MPQFAQKLFVAAVVALTLAIIVWQIDRTPPRKPPAYYSPPASDLHDLHHPELVGSAPRSSKWPTFRKHYLAAHPGCAACGTLESVELHHIQPFHERPELELDESNVIGLCREHHFTLGHRCQTGKSNWGLCSNPDVVTDAEKWRREHKLPPPK